MRGRLRRLAGEAAERPRAVPRSRGLHPHSREALATTAAGYGTAVEEVPLAAGVDRARSPRSATTSRPSSSSSRTSSAPSRTSRRWCRSPRETGALVVVQCDPLTLGVLRAARRVRRRHRGRRGPVARQPARLRRPVVRLLRRPGGVPAADAGPDRGRDDRRRRQARLRAHAADARAAHPAREGDAQHHDRADAERARRRRLPVAGSAAAGSSSSASCCCTARPTRASALAALDGVELLHEQPVVREFARAARRAGRPRDRALRRRGRQPRLPARRDYDEYATGCWWRSPSSARGRTSTGWPRCSAPRSPPSARRCTHERDASRSSRSPSPAARVRGARARRAARRRRRCPERFRRAEPPRLPEIAEPEIVRHYTRLSTTQLPRRRGLLPARLVHDEAQPEAARAGRGAARARAAAPAPGARARPGRAAADVGAAAGAGRDRRAAARLAAAVGRLAGRAGGRAAHARLPRGARRAAPQGPDARHRARHEPGDRDDGAATRWSRSAPTPTAASTSTTCARSSTTTSRR